MRKPAVANVIVITMIALLLSACASKLDRQLEGGGKGVMVMAYSIEGDRALPLAPYPARAYSKIYNFKLHLTQQKAFEGKKPARSRTEAAKVNTEEKDLTITVWQFFVLEPGEYFLARVHEEAFEEIFSSAVKKSTWFVDPQAIEANDAENAPPVDQTPRFTVNEGEVVYIGNFGTRLTTKPGELFSILLTDARKSYSFDPEAAQSFVNQNPSLLGLKFGQVDLFGNRPVAKTLLESPWSGRKENVTFSSN